MSFHPTEQAYRPCQILQGFSPDKGCLEGTAPMQSSETAMCHYWQCYIYFLSLHIAFFFIQLRVIDE